jgi:HK97 family phage major capsid protein
LIAGDGAGQNLTGILNTAGINNVAFAAGTALSNLALAGITAVLSAEADPTGVVVNQHDYEAMLQAKTSGSGVRLDSPGAFATQADSIWGLPLIVSTVMPQGQCLVGDFGYVTLFIREGVNVRASDADQDDFIRNRVTVLGEMRAAVAVFQPAAFALVHFA